MDNACARPAANKEDEVGAMPSGESGQPALTLHWANSTAFAAAQPAVGGWQEKIFSL